MPHVLRFVNVPTLRRLDAPQALVYAAAGNAAPSESPRTAAEQNVASLQVGIAEQIQVLRAADGRISSPPAPPATPTLRDLVQIGRRRLLSAGHAARRRELEAMQVASERLRRALQEDA